MLKTQSGETITLTAEEAGKDVVGDYWGGSVKYSVFPQFEIRQATLNKLANNKITKIRFELLSDVLECSDCMNLNEYIKKAKDAILGKKNSTNDALLDGF